MVKSKDSFNVKGNSKAGETTEKKTIKKEAESAIAKEMKKKTKQVTSKERTKDSSSTKKAKQVTTKDRTKDVTTTKKAKQITNEKKPSTSGRSKMADVLLSDAHSESGLSAHTEYLLRKRRLVLAVEHFFVFSNLDSGNRAQILHHFGRINIDANERDVSNALQALKKDGKILFEKKTWWKSGNWS